MILSNFRTFDNVEGITLYIFLWYTDDQTIYNEGIVNNARRRNTNHQKMSYKGKAATIHVSDSRRRPEKCWKEITNVSALSKQSDVRANQKEHFWTTIEMDPEIAWDYVRKEDWEKMTELWTIWTFHVWNKCGSAYEHIYTTDP